MQVWITSTERESLHTGKEWSISPFIPHFLFLLSSPSEPSAISSQSDSTREPLNSSHDETCAHKHTLIANDWPAGRRLVSPLSPHRGGIQPPPHIHTHTCLAILAWLNVTELSLSISFWMARYGFSSLDPLTVDNKERLSHDPCTTTPIPTYTNTRTQTHTNIVAV